MPRNPSPRPGRAVAAALVVALAGAACAARRQRAAEPSAPIRVDVLRPQAAGESSGVQIRAPFTDVRVPRPRRPRGPETSARPALDEPKLAFPEDGG